MLGFLWPVKIAALISVTGRSVPAISEMYCITCLLFLSPSVTLTCCPYWSYTLHRLVGLVNPFKDNYHSRI